MRFRRREPLFSILLDTGLDLLDSLRGRLPDNVDDIKGEYGTPMTPPLTAWAAPPMRFAAKKIRKYSVKLLPWPSDWGSALESAC